MKKWFTRLAGCAILFLYIWIYCLGNDPLQPSIASKILRFHVLANSDSVEDQAVKLEVRDAVGTYLKPYLKDVKNLKETKAVVEQQQDEIIAVAEETLREHGYAYSVQARLVTTEFPVKTYGDYTFPKGEYEALQIVLGKGEGHNWWCVLYPNMCFKGSVYEVVEQDASEELKEILSPLEYADVFDSGKVRVDFKFLEYFRERV